MASDSGALVASSGSDMAGGMGSEYSSLVSFENDLGCTSETECLLVTEIPKLINSRYSNVTFEDH